MEWKKVVGVMAAVVMAAYLGARLAAPEHGGRALAAGAGVGDPKEGLVAVTTGGQGADSNRLVMVDTSKKKILVYRVRPNYMRLAAVRSYKYDMKIEAADQTSGRGYTYEQVRDLILKSNMKEADKKSLPRGREMVLTTDGTGQDSNRVILINRAEKRILVYALDGNFIGLIAARRYEYDEQLEYTAPYGPGDGYDYKSIKKKVEEELKKRMGGGAP